MHCSITLNTALVFMLMIHRHLTPSNLYSEQYSELLLIRLIISYNLLMYLLKLFALKHPKLFIIYIYINLPLLEART
jgi:hypothetical protein